jgi:hypothetical protein
MSPKPKTAPPSLHIIVPRMKVYLEIFNLFVSLCVRAILETVTFDMSKYY